MATRIGVDIGGTFTDLIFFDEESGRIGAAKVPTTTERPDEGVLHAVASSGPRETLERAALFLHGTTVGLNALLERRGATVGLLATAGFRDVLEIRRGDRDEMYNLFWQPPAPLVPRHLRLPIAERTMYDGGIRTPLAEADVRWALEVFRREGVTSVAVAFLHAYANPEHELAAERILRREGFGGDISLSHRISGEYREYERTCTTVIDAYVRGRLIRYLGRLAERLTELGFAGDPLVTRSGSGAMTFAEAADRPFETIMSGPVAGAEGAGALARSLKLDGVITADVGGTSFDTCLVLAGRPQITYEGRIVGLPVQSAWVDVRSIGAGGGSIARLDPGGLLRVGPRSAGADPGPACYGRGGEDPTVTDAALLLGMLGPGRFASGTRLDRTLAERALRPIAERLALGVRDTARGVMTIAAATMADAIREITVEQGVDPREMHLLAFGGAGPMMATLLARELEIGHIVIPPYAGNFSALGLLGSDLTQSASRTRITRLSDTGLDEINTVLAELFTELQGRRSAGQGRDDSREVALDMRYVGQEYALTIGLDSDGGRIGLRPEQVRDAFVAEYARTFASTMDDAVEIVAARATLRSRLPTLEPRHIPATDGGSDGGSLPVYSFARDAVLDFRLVDRERLAVDGLLLGPAIIGEATATTYLDAGYRARVHPSGALFVEAAEGEV